MQLIMLSQNWQNGTRSFSRSIKTSMVGKALQRFVFLLIRAGLCERASFLKAQMAQLHGTLFSLKCSKYQSTNDPCDYEMESRYPINTVLTIPTNIAISNPNGPLPQAAIKDLPHCPKCNH